MPTITLKNQTESNKTHILENKISSMDLNLKQLQ